MQLLVFRQADGNGGGGGQGGGEGGAAETGVGVFGDETAEEALVSLMT